MGYDGKRSHTLLPASTALTAPANPRPTQPSQLRTGATYTLFTAGAEAALDA